ncbi:protein-disulfide reductase DsbD domain-containing protein [Roseibacillus persicicus]|uniref:protein-disulfide reductase DsbD domain-containing protein n=1 Tax=Roseibacillus persicicus TaxID=454148 RepID=UPI00398B3C06
MFNRYRTTAVVLAACTCSVQAESTAEVKLLAPPSVAAGSTVEVALELTPAETLHVYYINPGEMGQAVALDWQDLPEGITAGELRFPVPHRVKTGELPTNGYEETTLFFSQLNIAPSVEPGSYTFKAKASWLACNDNQCLVGGDEVELKLEVVAKGGTASEPSSKLAKGLTLIPTDASADWKSSVKKEGEKWLINLTPPDNWESPEELDAFSETSEFFKPGSVPSIQRTDSGLQISVEASEYSKDLSAAKIVLAGPTPPVRIPISLETQK